SSLLISQLYLRPWAAYRCMESRLQLSTPGFVERMPSVDDASSELQASLAGSIGQRLDATVVAVAGAVEGNRLDTGLDRLFGNHATHPGGSFDVGAALQVLADIGFQRGGSSQHAVASRGEH